MSGESSSLEGTAMSGDNADGLRFPIAASSLTVSHKRLKDVERNPMTVARDMNKQSRWALSVTYHCCFHLRCSCCGVELQIPPCLQVTSNDEVREKGQLCPEYMGVVFWINKVELESGTKIQVQIAPLLKFGVLL